MAPKRDTITPIKHMQRIKITTIRYWLFAALLFAAPLSKYPSISMPVFDFSSFRIGLYPVLSLLFILFSLPSVLKYIPRLYRQSRLSLVSILVLAFICMMGFATSLYKSRSALLISSILLLLGLAVTACWYVAHELPTTRYKQLLQIVLISGCFYGLLSVLQFIFAGFGHETFGLLCANCNSQVFGFPRISGFAAEPQFHANALLIYFFVGLGAFYKLRSRLSLISTILVLIGIGLSFSRGAFMALGLGTLIFFVMLRLQGLLRIRTIMLHFAAAIAACLVVAGLFLAAASFRYRSTPDIAYKTFRSMVQQVSVGLIELPESKSAKGEFTPAGLVIASGNDRKEAARLSLRAWNYNNYTRLFGVGAGNLGPFVVARINSNAPSNLTVYIYYILVLSELGILGLMAFTILNATILLSYIRKFWKHKYAPIYTGILSLFVAFLIQYCFFGSYINVPYIWLWIGILMGLIQKTDKSAIIKGLHEK